MKSSSEKSSGERSPGWLEMMDAERSETDQTISSSSELSSERLANDSSDERPRGSSACIAGECAMKLKEDARDALGERTLEVAVGVGEVAMDGRARQMGSR